jgi:glucokinase
MAAEASLHRFRSEQPMMILAADIGGTHARLAAIEFDAGRMRVVETRRYTSRDFGSLEAVVQAFSADSRVAFDRACIGVAAPISEGVCDVPNLPWTIRPASLAAATGIPHIALINDFEALGYSIPHLHGNDVATLQTGHAEPRGPIALIGAGTGLGQAFLLWHGDRYDVHASEGGHSTLAARTEIEWAFARSTAGAIGHVSYERVLSGPGLLAVYHHLARAGRVDERDAVFREVARDGSVAISRHGLAATDPVCVEALDLFVSVYGSQAGNLALTVMATGGVYLGGGIAASMVEKLRGELFLGAFRDKGRLAGVLDRMPIHVIVNTDAALIGAAAVASRLVA